MKEFNKRASRYANLVRVRVCGICLENNKVLVIKHQALDTQYDAFWSPPGGGVEFGENLRNNLAREINEETGLKVKVGRLLYVNEFIEEPLHAIELFFETSITGGELKTGSDPEVSTEEQLIQEAKFMSLQELNQIPLTDKHRIFHYLYSVDDLMIPKHLVLPQTGFQVSE